MGEEWRGEWRRVGEWERRVGGEWRRVEGRVEEGKENGGEWMGEWRRERRIEESRGGVGEGDNSSSGSSNK